MELLLENLAIAGYRSFGEKLQAFDQFAKINIFIGQNNAGKSNVLRFLYEVIGDKGAWEKLKNDGYSTHLPKGPQMVYGRVEPLEKNENGKSKLPSSHRIFSNGVWDFYDRQMFCELIGDVFEQKAFNEGTNLPYNTIGVLKADTYPISWLAALQKLPINYAQRFFNITTGRGGGTREDTFDPHLVRSLITPISKEDVVLIPAIRKIGDGGSTSDEFSGEGIIERLAKLQNPDGINQKDRLLFADITKFVQSVLDSEDATIEIPFKRDTIMVHMGGKVLPISSLGSGIHEVVILAAAATVLQNTIVCIEEPELHLNPILQKKLIKYLAEKTTNQYFITTHSASLMDVKNAEVYHITLEEGASRVHRVTSDHDRRAICDDLGYHPSDLLQANCIIWVEGPSDRIYINYWIKATRPALVEGIHYSIMFYGGGLAAHLTYSTYDKKVKDFVELQYLNRRGVMVMDSDKSHQREDIGDTKKRLVNEFSEVSGFAWVTAGREIENYIEPKIIDAAIKTIHKQSVQIGGYGKFDNTLTIRGRKKISQADKVGVATYVVENNPANLGIYDLQKKITSLVEFIEKSNGSSLL